MSSSVEDFVVGRIKAAVVRAEPFPYFYLLEAFPTDFYAEMRRNWPESSSLVSISETGRVQAGAYKERLIVPLRKSGMDSLDPQRRPFWLDFAQWFLGARVFAAMMQKFDPHIEKRFGDALPRLEFSPEALIVRDLTDYSIGPHTDVQSRVLSALFYCPDDDSRPQLGTSVYAPLAPDFRCAGGPHYPHKKFERLATMEYRANSLFVFLKTDNSFHGVEPISDTDVERDVLLYDVRVSDPEGKVVENLGKPPPVDHGSGSIS
jgi:hypothetical protein